MKGYFAREVTEKTGLSRGTLQGWRRNGFFDPQNPPRYTANEIKALKKIKV